MKKYLSVEEAVKAIKSNDRKYVQAAAANPSILTNALTERHSELRNLELSHLHTEGEANYANPIYKDSFHVNSFFIGENVHYLITEYGVANLYGKTIKQRIHELI
ncbi:MAG: acyl-CoA hydrolase [Planctomycetota bacterium]|jgi:acyl-CoA hydrolase